MEILNDEQLKAVQYIQGPLLIVAGAGTGKTHVIGEKIKYLIARAKLQPAEILVLTFSRKACLELQDRVAMKIESHNLAIHTFHSYGQSFIKQFPIATSISINSKILSTKQEELWALEYSPWWLPLSLQAFANTEAIVPTLLSFFNQMVDQDVSVTTFNNFLNHPKASIDKQSRQFYLTLYPFILESLQAYTVLKRKHHVLSFSDLLSIPVTCLRMYDDILEQEQAKYKYILVDEFQDTNVTQFTLLQMLAKEHAQICVCGDDDQAIYEFRGATIQNILNFQNVYPNSKKVTLIDNYRSLQPILDTSYRLIQHNNPHRLESILKINKKLRSKIHHNSNESKVLFRKFTNFSEEEIAIVDNIHLLKQRGVNLQQIAILVRKHSQVETITKVLQKAVIPCKSAQNREEMYQVKSLLLLFLECCVDVTNNDALSHLASSFLYTISGKTLFYLLHIAKIEHTTLHSLFLHIAKRTEIAPIEKKKIQKVMNDLKRYQQRAVETNTGTVLLEFIQEKQIFEKLLLESKESEVLAIQNLFKTIEQFINQTGLKRIDFFLRFIHENTDYDEDDKEQEAIQVSTIHQVKGKEFAYVFLPYLTQGSLPSVQMPPELTIPKELLLKQETNYIFEERRLLYVGITRAKEQVILSWTENNETKPSQFIQECRNGVL